MIFKLGDRVSFLNDTGGGIITKIVDDSLVHVTIEDGFEIPVLASELIKTGSAETLSAIERAHQQMAGKVEEPEYSEDIMPLYISRNNPDQRPEGIYFCFVPQVQDNPLSGPLDLFLINNTEYYSVFSLYLNYDGDYHGTEYGFIEPQSRLTLATIGRSQIEKWANALWQNLFYMQDKTRPMAPFSGLISFRPVKLYNEESFAFESLLRKKAFMVQVALFSEISKQPFLEEKISAETLRGLEKKINTTVRHDSKTDTEKRSSFLDKHKIDDRIAEIDLHIGELVENFTNLEKGDLLNIQLDYFKKCLKQAETEKLSKVIFIHGVGNGVLKTEINKILERTEGISFYEASYARYGMGATEVNFYRHS